MAICYGTLRIGSVDNTVCRHVRYELGGGLFGPGIRNLLGYVLFNRESAMPLFFPANSVGNSFHGKSDYS
jgi:hypothetical protein